MSFYNGILNHDDESGSVNIKGARGAPGIGFKLDLNNDYDMQNKKLVNVKQGTNNNDVITKSQLDIKTSLLDGSRPSYVVNDKAAIYSSTGAIHAQSLYLKDTPDNAGNSDEIRIMTEHQSRSNVHLNIPDIQNFDGYGGRPKSEFMITSVDQNVTGKKVFENIEVHDPTSNNQAANKNYVDFKIANNDQFVKKTGDVLTGDLILPHDNYPVQGNTNKAVSYETQREIFLSRKESFPMQADINMNNNFIQDVATPTTSHQGVNKGYCDYNFLNRQKGGVLMGPLSMNRNDLIGIPDTPKYGYSAVNKNYVDGEITKIDTSSFVKLDGSRAMTDNLDMGDHSIQKVGEPINSDDVATKKYVDGEIGYISTPFLKKDGSRTMTGNLNMNEHKMVSLKEPVNDSDAINKKYFEDKLLLSHLIPSHHENAFKYLLNRDESSSERNITVNGIDDFNGSPHKNKKAYDVDMIYTTGTQNYDSLIGINIYPLPPGKFTIIMEYYYPENINIAVLCQASSAVINKQISKNFVNYIKLLVQFEDQTKRTPDYLYFNISGSGTTSTNPEGYLVFYGMKEWYDNVYPAIYDHALESSMFEYDNGNMKMNTVLDMNNKKITNLSDGTDANDAINKGQFDTLKNKFDSHQFYIKNHLYMSIFTHRFYDLKEPIKFILDGSAISGINPNMSIISSGSSHITVSGFDPIRGLQFNPLTKIIIDLGYMVNQNSPYTIMISLTLKEIFRLYFCDSIYDQTVYYPSFIIIPTQRHIGIQKSNFDIVIKKYPANLNNKQLMVWITFNPSINQYEIILGNVNFTKLISSPISNFSTNKLRIDANNNIINKICYQNQHFASAETFTKMMFEERKNGSYF